MAVVAAAVSFGASPNAGPRDAVWGGGHFTFDVGGFQVQRDFSLTAELGRFGQPDGSFVYGLNGVSARDSEVITCLAVSANRAVIAGWDAQQGWPFLFYVVDNGKPSSGRRDQVSPLLLVDMNNDDLSQLPNDFPNTCPSPDNLAFSGFSFRI